MAATLVWFRQDLRLQDNPALAAALARRQPLVPVYILDDDGEGEARPGGASRWWLHHSLLTLDAALRERGLRLIVRRGETGEELKRLLHETGATAVYWNRRYEPTVLQRDKALKTELLADEIEAKSFNSALLFEPHTVANKSGAPFQVFTPFWRHCLSLPVEEPTRLRAGPLPAPAQWPASVPLHELGLLPRIPWDTGLHETWRPGEDGAQRRLREFLQRSVEAYDDRRDFPGVDGTSALSPHLHFGEIGPRQIWAAVRALGREAGVFPPHRGGQVFLKEVGWREFAYHLLYHFPKTPTEPLRAEFTRFPWQKNRALLRAWQQGRTGYPIVDAGMRQLWHTGWMHNRVRMIVASFLVKHLRLSWREGHAWFHDTLVDADVSSNTLGWQWSAGCGADAAPYFRIFNPVLQGRKFDPNGDYVRRWIPELERVPAEHIHSPWDAPPLELAALGIQPGRDYPAPVVEHGVARDSALAAFQSLRANR